MAMFRWVFNDIAKTLVHPRSQESLRIGGRSCLPHWRYLYYPKPRDKCALKLRCLNYYDKKYINILYVYSVFLPRRIRILIAALFKQFAYTVIRA